METPPTDPRHRPPPRRSGLLIGGALAALVAGSAVAWVLVRGEEPATPPPASEGGLVIDSAGEEDGRIDPGKPLRCFVAGQFVGELTLTACAERNGVATDALDVGLDESGALSAAQEAGQLLAPLPPPEENLPLVEEGAQEPDAEPTSPDPIAANCLRHGGGRWRRVGGDHDLDSCVQTLFAGRCERPGGASYGRYGYQTLRLVAGKVEVSDDNRTFRFLGIQSPDCSIPPLG